MQRGVVDRLGQQAGGGEAPRVAEPRVVQGGAHDELAHVAVRGDALEPVDVGAGVGRAVRDRHAGERVEAVGVDPGVRVGHAHGALGGVAQTGQGGAALGPRPRG